jgi:IclR family transcriptional regulator, pca regulon regulatory protein
MEVGGQSWTVDRALACPPCAGQNAQMASPRKSETVARTGDHMLVLERGLAVIECFDGRDALSVTEVARLTGMSRPAARRCLLTLVTLQYATSDGRVFRLAPRVLRLGFSYLSKADLPQIVQPALERLSSTLNESCSAAVLDGTDVLYIARVATERIISVDLRVGSRLPAYCNAMGRVILAAMPPDQSLAILERTDRTQRTKATLTKLPDLIAELDRVRKQDYSIVRAEPEVGLLTIAVPIRNSRQQVVAAVNVGGHVERSSNKRLIEETLPALRKLQAELSPLLR